MKRKIIRDTCWIQEDLIYYISLLTLLYCLYFKFYKMSEEEKVSQWFKDIWFVKLDQKSKFSGPSLLYKVRNFSFLELSFSKH